MAIYQTKPLTTRDPGPYGRDRHCTGCGARLTSYNPSDSCAPCSGGDWKTGDEITNRQSEGRRGGSVGIRTRSVTWLGFDKSRSADGSSPSLNSSKSHDKEAITCFIVIPAICAVLGWLVGQL